ncbi:ABC transporter substrate-binding protein [Virgisporangium aurantiacum]|uniref:ABC transporter substrate-binding protein n=1 Tax=Virgisporangium aurantiacum TaxID=175570 RepID=A0A8J4DXR6_9ACTN|nr:ABC transporter substrate-binding protein [Virgisporangium aurantiacum]GIJ54189.1 ABC transporter substrate-binding protein [Virgisporangium aurantiacum]
MTPRSLTALVLVSILTAGSLAACTGDDDSSDPGTLTILSSFTTGNATGDHFAKLKQKFTDETGIKIDVEEANTNDIGNVYEASKLANKERDIVILNFTPTTSDWLPQSQVVDVKKYLDQWGLTDQILPEAMKFWTQPEGVAGFPYIGFNWPVWYNTDLLKKAGVNDVPKTVDDLISASQKLKAQGVGGIVLGGAEWPVQNWITWMIQQYVPADEAQKIFEKGGYCASAGAVKGLNLFGRLRDSGVFIDNVQGYTADQMTTTYRTQKAAMVPNGSWAYPDTPAEVANVTRLAGFPVVSDGIYKKPTAFQGHSNGFFLSPNGEKKIASVEKFIRFMYRQDVVQSWVSDAAQIMSVKPDLLGAARSSLPLVQQGASLAKDVDFMLLPDSYLPSGMDYQPAGTKFIGSRGMKGEEFCKDLDKLYQK